MKIKLLTEHHLEFLSLKVGFTGSYESTFVKIPHCWKSHVKAHICPDTSKPSLLADVISTEILCTDYIIIVTMHVL